MEAVAVMVMLMTLFVTIGGVILLRPIFKHLGEYLRVMAEHKKGIQGRGPELARIENVLVAMENRLNHLEDRQQFSEALLDSKHTTPFGALEEVGSTPDGKRNSTTAE